MKEKLSLDKAWELCLDMWKWIGEQIKGNIDYEAIIRSEREAGTLVEQLKTAWIKKNLGETFLDTPENWNGDDVIQNNCFFCEYTNQEDRDSCADCPMVTASQTRCLSETVDCYKDPIGFYEFIVELNRKRK